MFLVHLLVLMPCCFHLWSWPVLVTTSLMCNSRQHGLQNRETESQCCISSMYIQTSRIPLRTTLSGGKPFFQTWGLRPWTIEGKSATTKWARRKILQLPSSIYNKSSMLSWQWPLLRSSITAVRATWYRPSVIMYFLIIREPVLSTGLFSKITFKLEMTVLACLPNDMLEPLDNR